LYILFHLAAPPFVASTPHFYLGDPLLYQVFNLVPNKEKHATFIDIEPVCIIRDYLVWGIVRFSPLLLQTIYCNTLYSKNRNYCISSTVNQLISSLSILSPLLSNKLLAHSTVTDITPRDHFATFSFRTS
jgi:hypothetical protein